MKKLFCILILLIAFNGISQNLDSCKTVAQVKNLIKGDWRLKGDTKNVVYRFSFYKNQGFIEVLPEMNLPPKAEKTKDSDMIINKKSAFNIQLKQEAFFVVIQNLNYEVTEKIEVLNKSNFIYGKGHYQHVFIKDN